VITLPLPSVTSGAGGTATIPITPNGNWRWIVAQISTEAPNAPIGSSCKVRFGGAIVVPFMVPTGDVASGQPPLEVPPGRTATIEWAGLGSGVLCKATILYEQVR